MPRNILWIAAAVVVVVGAFFVTGMRNPPNPAGVTLDAGPNQTAR